MKNNWRKELHEIVFESHSRTGKIFDIILLSMIVSSIIIVMLDSVYSLHLNYGKLFHQLEWAFTILFSLEYLIRIIVVKHRTRFIFSFLGIIDLVAILPTYFTLVVSGTQPMLVMRALRLLRIFRIFRLSHFLVDIRFLSGAMLNSLRKIGIFFLFALVIIIILGSVMYLVEDHDEGFYNIPQCIYWAITTITTVGYGDLVPTTPLGKVIANIVMLIGYAIIAVPTGIITTEMAMALKSRDAGHEVCNTCNKRGHEHDAVHCKYCGAKFETPPSPNHSEHAESHHTILPGK